jgi:hypothetical protein
LSVSLTQREPVVLGPGAARASWRRRGGALYRLLLLSLVVGAVVWGLRSVWAFTIDDAGISYAYARHIADGHGPVAAVGGPRIEGYSNPLWVFMLVPVHWLGLPVPVFAKAFGAGLFAAALLAGMSFMLRVKRRTWRSFGAAEACFAIVCALCLEVAVWVPAGLENALFGALLLGMIALDARESEDPTAFGSSGLCAFGLAITRPEAALYVAALLLVKAGAALRKREPIRQVVTALSAFAIPFVLYHVGHFLVFGELLPNTYRAKPGGSGWLRGLQYLTSTARESGLIYAVPLALVGLYGRLRLRLLIGWAWLAGTFFLLYAGGDWMPHGRFLSLFAPVVVVLAALGLSRLAQVLARLSRGRLPREAVILGLASLASLAWSSYQLPRLAALRRQGWCHFCERVADTDRIKGLASRAGLASHSLVTHDFGGPSWLSDDGFYPIDFLGLCDRSIVSIRAERPRGGMRNELRLYQYLIHEQPVAPSWILVPPNFWPGFDQSPEYRSDYYALEARQLPRARRDSFFVLHRGELVDYFPPVSKATRRSLTEQLDLVGFGVFAGAAPPAKDVPIGAGAKVSVLVSVVPRSKLLGTEQLSVRVEAGAETVESPALRLDRGLAGVARQLGTGEPLSIELPLELPPGPDATYRLSLAVAHASGKRRSPAREAAVVPLVELPVGGSASRLERSLPRYPAALPAPTQPELRELRPAVTRVIEQNRSEGRAAAHDEPLGQRLVGLGQKLEAQGQLEQAYLAYVWATQVDRSAWTALAETIHRLRPTALGDEHALEVALLEQYYTNGGSTELARLVAFYLAAQRPLEARYLLERWPVSGGADPEAALRVRLEAALAAADAEPGSAGDILAEVAVDPLGGALDFEAVGLEAWTGQRNVYRAGPSDDGHGLPALRGYHGRGLLSSTESGTKGRGAILSPEFRLTGRLMTLLVGGGSAKQKVGVELLVGDEVVLRASGNDSDNLTPVFWNVAAFEGKSARLRVFDKSTRQRVLLDRVLCWR